MAKYSNPTLQPNPFITYRDPKTGLWVVINNTTTAQSCTITNPQEPQDIQSTRKKGLNPLF